MLGNLIAPGKITCQAQIFENIAAGGVCIAPAQRRTAEKRNPRLSVLMEMLVNPADWRRAGSAAGSTGTRVSEIWSRRIIQLSVLSTPANTPPGRRTRQTSRKSLSWNSTDGTWWSMVKATAPEKE